MTQQMEQETSSSTEAFSKNAPLDAYQDKIKEVAEKFEFDWSNYVQYVHLVEEVAELGEALTVREGDRQAGSGEQALADHADVKEEIGDIFFTLGQLANQLGVKLTDAMDYTFTRYDTKLKKLKETKSVSQK